MSDAAAALAGGQGNQGNPTTGGAEGAAAAAANGGGSLWYSAHLQGEMLGYVQNKGWKLDSPAEFAGAMVKNYRELEAFRGIPAEQIVKWPKDAGDEAAWKAVYGRLGVPEKAEDYTFGDGLKFKNGEAVADDFANRIRNLALKLKLTPAQAEAIARDQIAFNEEAEAGDTASNEAQIAAARLELDRNWGANKEANTFIARQAAEKIANMLGGQRDKLTGAIAALENQAGFPAVMEMFLALGKMMGEDRFVAGNNPAASGVMSRDQAMVELKSLQGDPEWVRKYMAGGKTEADRFKALTTIISGGVR